jgi:hypothetical protein
VELVNAFRINSSLKWSKLYSNRVSNIISECSNKFFEYSLCEQGHRSSRRQGIEEAAQPWKKSNRTCQTIERPTSSDASKREREATQGSSSQTNQSTHTHKIKPSQSNSSRRNQSNNNVGSNKSKIKDLLAEKKFFEKAAEVRMMEDEATDA